MNFLDQLELEPAEVPVSGVKGPVKITRFSFDYMKEVIIPKAGELPVEKLALYFLNSEGYEHSQADVEALGKKLGVGQLVEIYNAGMQVNGAVVSAETDAKKD